MAATGLNQVFDQSQIADAINRQKIGSQRQRREMMRLGETDPNAFSLQNKSFLQQAQQPTEFLGAGRTDNIPTVSLNGQQLTGYDDSNLGSLYSMNSGYKDTPFDYTDSVGKGYYTPDTQSKVESSAPNFLSGSFNALNNPSGNYYDPRGVSAGGYYFADPWGFSHSLSKAGNNKYFVSENTLNEHTRSGTANTWFSLKPDADLSGLQYGQFQGQNGLFFDPTETNLSSLLIPGRNNSAYAKKKSGGILAPLNKALSYVDPLGHAIEGGVADLLGYDSGLDMVRNLGEPIGNLAGAIWSGGIPWGSIAMGAENASTGNWEGVGNNAINGLASYAGSNVGSGGVMGTGVSLGSAAANSAANNMIINAGANYARTGDLENALKAEAFSTASGAAGNWLGSATTSHLGEIGSKALGGAASGGLNSLFTKNSPIEGSLFGAMSGGLHGFLNSTDRSNNTYSKQQDTKNRQTAQAATKLAKLFTKK